MNRDSMTRFIMILLLVLVGMMAWQQFFPRTPPPAPTPAPVTDPAAPPPPRTQADAQPPAATPPVAAVQPLTPAAVDVIAQPVRLGSDEYLGPFAMALELDPRGAGISRLTLSDYFATVQDRSLPNDERQKLALIDTIERAPAQRRTSFALEGISLGVPGQAERLVISGLGAAVWNLVSSDQQQAVFELHLNDAEGQRAITIRRTWRLPQRGSVDAYDMRFARPEAFGPTIRHDVQVVSGPYADITLQFRGPEGIVREDARSDARRAVVGWRSLERSMESRTGKQAQSPEDQVFPETLDWAGVINKYFAVVVMRDENVATSRWNRTFAYVTGLEATTPVPGVFMETEPMPLLGEARALSVTFTMLAAPRDDDLLAQTLWNQRGMMALAEFAGTCCIPIPGVKELAKLMIWAINGLAAIVRNYGVAIIILVIIVRLIMLPISRFSQMAMMRMKEVQPEIAKLKERFKDDPQQLQLEQMKLFREKGANPMLGCLPMVLQIPIWIALYTGIEMATALRHAPFVLWVQDLSQPDALLSFAPVTVPVISFIGNWANWNLNILPILMAITMVMQMRLQADATSSTPEMQKQQKMMKWMMPVMLLLFLYGAPAALNLYILTSSFIGFLEQKYFRWHFEKIKNLPRKPGGKGIIGAWLEKKMEAAKRLQDIGSAPRPKLPLSDRKDRDQRRPGKK